DPDAAAFVLLRYMDGVIAFTAKELADRFGLPLDNAQSQIARWHAEGRVEPAPFEAPSDRDPADQAAPAGADAPPPYWSSRKVASRLIKLSLAQVRRGVEPAAPAQWQRLLLTRHGLDRSTGTSAASHADGQEALR